MFSTELNSEEECLLSQFLDGKKLNRISTLQEINYACVNTDDKECLDVAKSLFAKIKSTSDYEFEKYVSLLLEDN